MSRIRFKALVWLLWVLAAKASRSNASATLEAECHEGDAQDLLQVSEASKHPLVADVVGTDSDLIMVGKKDTCERIEWPCGDSVACHWPLQQINRGGNCMQGTATAYITSLNLEDGSYKSLCKFTGICLNACSISRPESAIYCRANGPNSLFNGTQQFVRLACPLTDFEDVVEGSVCYFGDIAPTYAASFDENDGTFYWKTNGGQINKLNATAISDLVESTVPLVEGDPNWDQVRDATIDVVQDNALNSVADFVIEQGDRLPPEARIAGGNPPEDRYLVACQNDDVYIAAVKPIGKKGNTPALGGPTKYTMHITNNNPPAGQSGAQWFFKGEIYCAYNKEGYGVYKVNVSEVDVEALEIPTSYIVPSETTSSNDGLNCLNVTSPFPPPPPATTSTTSTSTTTTTTTTTTIPKVRCSNGHGDWDLDNAALGSLEVGKEIVPGVTLVEFDSGGNANCTSAAIFSQENGGDGAEEQNLKNCGCDLLIVQNNASVAVQDKVYVCSPIANQVQVVLEFDDTQKILGLQMWNTYSGITQFRWENENQLVQGTVTVPPSAEGAGTGFVDISAIEPLATKVKKVGINFGGPAGLKSIRFCKEQGSIVGDPHVHTLDGKTYILLQQGTFLMWRLSGLETEFPSHNLEGMQKAQVDWQIFVHYSGSKSFTKGLLILDKSKKEDRQALELTSDDCLWRKRSGPKEEWSSLDRPQMLSMPEADFVTGFNVVWHSQDTELRKHVRFVMNTKHGVRSIATLHVSCQPGHHINARVEMDQLGYAHFIQGEVGRARAKPLGELPELRGHLVDPHHQADLLLNGADGVISAENRDEEFHSKFHWTDLGGSSAGSQYLKAVDEEGIPSVTPCLPNDESRAHEICSKHFGGPDDAFFSDCVFDVCAGGGEISAELLAAIV